MATTQYILLAAGVFIVLLVVIFSLSRFFKKTHKDDNVLLEDEDQLPNIREDLSMAEEVAEQENYVDNGKVNYKENIGEEKSDFMMISVHAKPNFYFSDYSFLQTLGSAGLEYGEHKIFHYDVKTDIGMQRLFSVAQLNKPGTFDIDNIEDLRCKGLLLFIDLRACRKQALALDCMLETAYQLAEDLDGIMYEGYNIPWTDETAKALAQKIESNFKSNSSILDEVSY